MKKKTVSEDKSFLYCYQVNYIAVSTKSPGIELNLKEILFLLTLLLVFLGLSLNSRQYLWLCTLLCDIVGQIFHSDPVRDLYTGKLSFFLWLGHYIGLQMRLSFAKVTHVCLFLQAEKNREISVEKPPFLPHLHIFKWNTRSPWAGRQRCK